MRAPSTLSVTRTAGLAVWAVTAIPGVLALAAPAPGAPAPPWPHRALSLVAFVAFAPAFWWNARRIQGRAPTRSSRVVLAIQAAFALFTVSDLVILTALEVPFVLVGRAAVLSAAALVSASALRAFAAGGQAFLSELPWLSHLPLGFVVALTIATNALWQGLAFAGGWLVANQERGADELRRMNAELRATQDLLRDSTRLAERLRLSRELHDAAGHHLAALSLGLELAARRTEGAAAEPIREAQAVAKLLLADIREMVGSLRQQRALDLRLALGTLAAGAREPRVHLALPEGLELTEPAQAHAIFRCVQEAITNAVRHGRARNLWVELARGEDRLTFRVRDDGRGAEAPRPGNGLAGMRERLEEVGGGLELASSPGRGFRLDGWLPLEGARS